MSLTPLPAGQAPWATNPGAILLDFWAPWCGSCKAMEPTLADVAKSRPHVQFFKVNSDDGQHGTELATSLGITQLPTLLLIHGGKVINRASGSMGRSQIKDFLDACL